MFSSIFFWFLTHRGSLTLYSSLWTILIIYLLIIWTPYLSTYPIRHPLWLCMSCGSQGSIVQGSSPYKCDQKSSCSAFNVVATALSQIFPSSYSSSIFVMLAPSSGVSWKVTLSDRIYIWSVLDLSEEIFLLWTPFPTFPLEYYFSGLWT